MAVTTLSDNFPLLTSPGESQTASGYQPSVLLAGWAQNAPERGAMGDGRPGLGGALTPAQACQLPVSLTTLLAHPGNRRQVSPLLARWGRSAGPHGSVPLQPPITRCQGLNAQQVSLPMI